MKPREASRYGRSTVKLSPKQNQRLSSESPSEFANGLQTPSEGSGGHSDRPEGRQGLRYVQIVTDKAGRRHCYFRRGGVRRPLPDLDSPWFDHSYQRALQTWAQEDHVDLFRRDIDRLAGTLASRAKRRAQEKQIDCDLDAGNVATLVRDQECRCAVTDLPFRGRSVTADWHANPYAPSLDRIDCAKGYTLGNVRVVLAAVNAALDEWGEDVLLDIAQALTSRTPSLSFAGGARG
jgi:hypothetical protein